MESEDNSLEQPYEGSTYDASLEARPTTGGGGVPPRRFRSLKFNKLAFLISLAAIVFILLIGLGSLFLTGRHNNKADSDGKSQASQYKVGDLSLQGIKNSSDLKVGQADRLAVNGQLRVSNTVVLAPGSVPASPTAGQIYYDKTTNQPYYFNGTAFVSLAPVAVPQHITSLGGAAGVIALGNGLQITGNQLGVSSALLQAVASMGNLNGPRVSSIQGLTGDVSFTAGNGISINGTTISNSGVASLTPGSASILISNDGNGNYVIDTASGGAGQVNLGPNVPQVDPSNNPSISINKTGTGDLLSFASNGVSKFVVDQNGLITAGTISYSQVQGRPATVVTDIAGLSGALTLGAGLGTLGNSLVNTGVVSLAGTPDQVNVSSSSGSITVSLPQSIAMTSAPTFSGLTVQGASGITVGTAGSVTGVVNLANAGSANLGTLRTASLGQSTTYVLPDPGQASADICLSSGNCAGTGGGIIGSGTNGRIARFNGANSITDSGLSETGSTLTYSGNVVVNTAPGFTGNLINLEVNGSSKLSVDQAGNSVQAGTLTVNGTGASTIADSLTVGTGLTVTTGGASIAGGLTVTSGGANIAGAITLSNLGLGLVQSDAGGLLSSGAVDRNNSAYFTNALNVANGGTGTNTFATNGILFGNGAGAIQATASAADSILYTDASGIPGLTQTLPTVVQGNITSTGALAGGSITNGFGAISTGNNITTTAALQGGTLTVTGGSFTVDVLGNVAATGMLSILGAGGLNLGVPGTTAGSLNFSNNSNSHISTLRSLAPAGQDQIITIPATTGGSDTICLLTLANCVGSGSGVTTVGGAQNYLTKYNNAGATEITNSLVYDNGTGVSVGGTSPAGLFNVGASNQFQVSTSGAVTAVGVNAGTGALQGNSLSINGGTFTVNSGGAIAAAAGITSSGAITFSALNSAGIVHTDGNGTLSTGTVTLGTETSGSYVANIGTVTGLSVSGNSGAGSTPSLSVLYGATAATAVQGNTTLTCASGSGNLTGGGNSITLGSGGTCGALSVVSSPTFSGTLSVQGAGGIVVGVAGTTTGLVSFANNTNTNLGVLQSAAPTGTGNATYTLPSIAGGASDTICLASLGNCSGASGSAGGDLTGTYPNPTIAKLQGTTLTINTPLSGQFLQYNGTAFVNQSISNDITIDGSGVATIGNGVVTNLKLANSSLSVTAGTGLTGGGSVALGGSTAALDVLYGATSGTAAQGNTALSFTGAGNLTGTVSGTAGGGFTSNTLAIVNSPTFSGNLTVQGAGGVVVGVAGSTTGVLTLANSSNTNLGTVQVATLGQATVYTLPDPGVGSAIICLNTGNCAGSGGGITGSGTPGRIAKFNTSGSITDSLLSESGTSLTYSGNVIIQGSNSLSLGVASTADGSVSFSNAAGIHTVTLQAPSTDPTSNLVFKLPSAYGSNGSCLISDGSGGMSFQSCTGGSGGGVTSLDGQTGVLTLANSSGSAGTITIDNASTSQKGIAQFNATNFTASSGVINTVQDIATTAAPTFNGLTINSGGATINGVTTLNGSTSITGSNTFTVGTGATTLGGTLGVTGLTTLSGGATITGSTNINTSGTANTSIGNATGSFSLASSALNISSSGALTGVTGITTSGAYTQSGVAANTFSGATTFSGSGTGLVVSNDANIGGNLSIGGTTTIGSGITLTTSGFATLSGPLTVSRANATDLAIRLQRNGDANYRFTTDVSGAMSWGGGTGASDVSLSRSGVGQLNLNGALGISSNLTTGGDLTVTSGTTTLGGALYVGSGSPFQVDTSGNVTSATINGQTISSSAIFTGTLAVQGASMTIGTPGSVAGSLNLANSSSSRVVTLQGLNPSGTGNATVQIPTIAGGSTDTVCLLTLANCVGTGGGVTASGGTQNYLTKFTNVGGTQIGNSLLFDNGTGVSVGGTSPIGLFNVGTSNQFQVAGNGNVTGGTYNTAAISGGTLSGGSFTGGTVSGSTLTGSGLTFSAASAATIQSAAGQALNITGHAASTISTDAGNLTLQAGSGTVSLGTSTTLNASGALTLASGGSSNLTLSSASGTIQGGSNNFLTTGNVTGTTINGTTSINTGAGAGTQRIDATGNLINIGTITSGLINGQTISSTANFTGTVAVQGAGGLTLGVAGSVVGSLNLANNSSSRVVTLQGLNPSGTGNAVIQLPSIAGGATDTVCLLTLANCTGAGSVTGTGTAGRLSKFTGTSTIADSGLSEAGTTLTYSGNAVVNAGSGFTGNLINLQVNGSSKFSVDELGNTIQGGTLTVNGTGASSVAGSLSVGTGLTVTAGGATITAGGLTVTAGNSSFGANVSVSGTLSAQGAGGLVVGVPGTTTGNISLANSSSSRTVILQGLNPSGTGNATIQFPTIAGGSTDTVCLATTANCTAIGAAGGDLTGTYPNPTIAKLQGTTLTLSSVASGQILQYNGTAFVNSLITNANLQAGSFGNITGTGALSSGSIVSGFGSIATTSDITTTTLVQGGTVNATTALQLGGVDINTAGTLTNVAYLNANQTFTGLNQFAPAASSSRIVSILASPGQTGDLLFAQDGNGSRSLSITSSAGIRSVQLANSLIFQAGIGGANNRFQFTTNGQLSWGDGTSPVDTTLYRSGAGSLVTDTSLTVQGANALTLGQASTNTGAILFKGSGGTGTLTLSGPATPNAGNYTLSLPAITGNATVCTDNAVCTGYAPSTGSANYIQNQSALSQTADFQISGTGRANTALQTPALDAATAASALTIGASNANAITIGNTSGATALTLQAGTGLLNIGNDSVAKTNTINIGAQNTGADLVAIGSSNASSTLTLEAGTGASAALLFNGATAHTVQLATGAAVQAVTIGSTNTTSSLTLQAGTGALNIGNDSVAKTTTINIGAQNTGADLVAVGSNNASSTLILEAGTGATAAQLFNGATAHTVQIATGAAAQTVTLGSTNTTSTTTIQGGTGAGAVSIQSGTSGTISLGTSGVANTIQIGNTTGAVTQTINVGNNATASSTTNLTVGSVIGTSSTTIQAGTSGTLVKGASSTSAFQVQSAGSVAVLNVDTTNLRVTTGGDLNVGSRFGNRLFSDGFESGSYGLWDDDIVGTTSVSTTTTHNGKYAAVASPSSGTGAAYTHIAPSSTVYVRAWVNVTSQTSTNADLLQLVDTNASNNFILYRNTSNQLCLWNAVIAASEGCWTSSFTTAGWHMLELRITVATSTTGTSQVWLDGTQVFSSTNRNNGTTNLGYLGIGDDNGGKTFTAYFDDISADAASNGTGTSLNVDDSFHVGGTASFGSSVLIQSASNSEKAFQVQNSAGAALLTADTRNMRVTVQSAVDAATATEIFSSFPGSPSGWTNAGGNVTHNTGNTTALSATLSQSPVSGTEYRVSYRIINPTAVGSTLNVAMGGVTLRSYTFDANMVGNGTTDYFEDSILFTASSTAGLTFTPSSTFNGKIVIANMSVKRLTAYNDSALTVSTPGGSASLEVRAANDFSNMFVGTQAGRRTLATAGGNTALGSLALSENVDGSQNTAVGTFTLQNNVSGSANTALGSQALFSNQGGSGNTAIGAFALYDNVQGYSNTAVGYDALNNNVSGFDNVAIGASALSSNTTGFSNHAIGSGALLNNTTGYGNIGIGNYALGGNTTGYDNIAIGSLSNNTTGYQNVGMRGLQNNTTGASNTGLGIFSLYNNTSGNGNTGVGIGALDANVTGNNNIGVGNYANVLSGGLSNAGAIGSGATVGTSNTIVLGRSGGTKDTVVIGSSYGTIDTVTGANKLLSVGTQNYSTGTISQTGTAITGSGTTFHSGMVGATIVYNDGTRATITAFGSTTSLTSSVSKSVAGGSSYNIIWGGMNIANTGTMLLQPTTDSTDAFTVKAADGTTVFNIDTFNNEFGIGRAAQNGYQLSIQSNNDTTLQAKKIGAGGNILELANNTSTVLTVTSAGVMTLAGTTSTFANLTLTDAHFKVTQTNAPTIAAPTVCTGTATVVPGSTDSAGTFYIDATSVAKCSVVLTFNKAYGATPKAILTSPDYSVGGTLPTSTIAAAVTAKNTTTVTFAMTANAISASRYGFSYWVVE